MAMMREMKNADQHNRLSPIRTYASVAAGNGLVASIHNPLNQYKAPPAQVLREIVVNIRNPLTISSLRAMNPCSLKAHVDRAIEQSGNEHIDNIKTMSTNQLKMGALSIKTASAGDMEALRQFAEDWEHRLGNGATVRIPTYGVLVHGIRTNSMDVSRFEDIGYGHIGTQLRLGFSLRYHASAVKSWPIAQIGVHSGLQILALLVLVSDCGVAG